jgi:oligopeptide transport system substrate-binding protein
MRYPWRTYFTGRRSGRPRYFLYLGAVWALLWVGAGCRPQDTAATPADGTPTATAGGVQAIVTRLVQQITVVTRTPEPAGAAEEDRPPVELDISLSGELPDLDPGLAESQAQLDLSQNLFAGLTNYNPDTAAIEPELASTWSVGADGRTWTFHLRDDVFWVRPQSPRPGSEELWSAEALRPVVADDVVFAVQRLCAGDVATPLAFSLFIIEGCEALFTTPEPTEADLAAIGIRAVDETTLEIRLTEPAGYFLTITSLPFFQPVPRDLVTEMGDEWVDAIGEYSTGWQTPDNLVTSGPYLPISSEFTSQRVVLHRNPLWPLDRPGNVDVVNITFLEDEMDAYELWEDSALDIAPLPLTEREAFMARSPAKAKVIPDLILFYVGFDFGSTIMREPEVRRALSAAIDRERLIEELHDGRGIPMRHASSPGVVAAIPFDEVGIGYSPDYARQQMAASTARDCRLLPAIRLLVSSADLSLRQAELIRDMWVEELACSAESISIEQVQFGALLAATRQDATGRPDMWELAWSPTLPDVHNMLNDLLHCRDSENRQNRECSETDALLTRAGALIDPAERAALYRQAESQFFNENGTFPIIPLYVRTSEIVVQEWISFTPVVSGGQQWDRIILQAEIKELEQVR